MKDIQKTETERFNGIEPSISCPGTLDRDKLKYNPQSGVVSGTETFCDVQVMLQAIRRSLSPDNPYAAQILASIGDLDAMRQKARGKATGWGDGVYTVSWHLQIGSSKARVVLEPDDDYQNWMPQLPMGAGNSIKIKTRIVEPAGSTGKFEFKLQDVSKEPGICMNYPTDDPDDGMDLRIAPVGSGMVFGGDGQSAKTDIDVNEAMVMVQSRDWGAYGKLSVIATLIIGGEEVEYRAIFDETGEPYISIPKDNNSNSIADAWEEQHGVYPCAGDADNDDQPEGKCPGDGLSAYQEYRGFFVQGHHRRLNPKKKELFVYDPDGLVQQSNLAAATQLEILYPTGKECRCDGSGVNNARVVNFNTGRYHVVDQHCLWVKKESLPVSDSFNWGYCEGGTEIGPPRTADKYVLIYTDQIREDIRYAFLNNKPEISNTLAQRGLRADDAWMETNVLDAIKMVTAHEVCHGLGVTHHFKSMRHSLPKLDDIEAAILSGDIDPSFGQMSCVMRYVWDGSRHPKLIINAHKEVVELLCGRPWPNTLCGSGGFDDCRGQLIVSDAERGHFSQ